MSLIYELFKDKIDKINIIRTFLYHDLNNIDKLGYTFLNYKKFLHKFVLGYRFIL